MPLHPHLLNLSPTPSLNLSLILLVRVRLGPAPMILHRRLLRRHGEVLPQPGVRHLPLTGVTAMKAIHRRVGAVARLRRRGRKLVELGRQRQQQLFGRQQRWRFGFELVKCNCSLVLFVVFVFLLRAISVWKNQSKTLCLTALIETIFQSFGSKQALNRFGSDVFLATRVQQRWHRVSQTVLVEHQGEM